jgi:hypothetical protein
MNSLDVCNFFYIIVLYYILFRERIKAVERHPEIGKSSAKCFNGNTLILPKRLTILDLNYGWFKFKFWPKIIGWILNNFVESSALFFDHVIAFFPGHLLFPYSIWTFILLLYPFSIWTFIAIWTLISLSYLVFFHLSSSSYLCSILNFISLFGP